MDGGRLPNRFPKPVSSPHSILGRNVVVEAGAVVGADTVLGNSPRSSRVMRDCNGRSPGPTVISAKSCVITGSTIADRNIIKDHVTVGDGERSSGAVARSAAARSCRPNLQTLAGQIRRVRRSIVSMSLIYGIKWPGSLFRFAVGVGGLANVELTPEFALKLGQALGSAIKPGQSILTSRDAHPAARVLNRCVISGLLSVGCNVEDSALAARCRWPATPRVSAATAAYIRASIRTIRMPYVIEVMDESGINIDKPAERKIENLFLPGRFSTHGQWTKWACYRFRPARSS